MVERAKIQSILDDLKKNSRIDTAFCKELDNSFEAQSLCIGIVGKMKAGKSSLVNAVVFSDNILPTGMRPVTVTLTEISYGEKDDATVELMSKKDIEDLKEKASYSGDDKSLLSKAEAAKETLDSLSEGFEQYLDMPSQTIELKDLRKYVDADGECSGLAKSVKIHLNNKNLKGITIIDTPGFNDPISSRGETTKNALSKCHVLLFVHNKDGYDETDVNLLTDQIAYAGISEIVDILNKIDMLGGLNKWPEKLELFIQKRNDVAEGNEVVKSLLEKSHATYISSLMALCGLIPHYKMDDDMKFQYSGFEEDFEELCKFSDKKEQQEAFVKYSNVNSVIKEINRLSHDGSKYLVDGPLMTLKGKLKSIKETIEAEIEEKRSSVNSLNVSIEANQKNLNNFNEFMNSVMTKVKVSSLENDLSALINQAISDVLQLRAEECDKEITEGRYPDPGFGDTGITKGNVASYNTFVSGFECKLRDCLSNLKDSCINTCKREINNLITSLSNTSQIDKEHMDNLGKALINDFVKYISNIAIIVSSKRINSMPSGNQKQWDRLRGRFLTDYDDNVICNLNDGIFSPFKQNVDSLDYVSTAIERLDVLKNEIEDSLTKSPAQKKKEVDELNNKIEELSKELNALEDNLVLIDNLKKDIS